MPLTLDKYVDCVCELRTMQNALVAVGVVKGVVDDHLVIGGANRSSLPVLAYNMQVKASVLGHDSDFLIVVGTVFISTEQQLKLADITTLEQYERRNFFRISVRAAVDLHSEYELENEDVSGEVQDEKAPPITGRIMDVSLGGCLIETTQALDVTRIYLADFILYQVRHTILISVRRAAGVPEGDVKHHRYGCIFEGNSERKLDAVCKDLFTLQRKALQTRVRI